jgi:hypothetical protein
MKSNTKTAVRTKHNAANGKRKPRNAVATRAAAVQVIRPLTAGSLKEVLWETLTDLKHENILPNRADAIAAQSREILRTIKIQLQVAGAAKRAVSYDDWKTHNPDDDRCEFCGAAPLGMSWWLAAGQMQRRVRQGLARSRPGIRKNEGRGVTDHPNRSADWIIRRELIGTFNEDTVEHQRDLLQQTSQLSRHGRG